jgi:hypothetical protein
MMSFSGPDPFYTAFPVHDSGFRYDVSWIGGNARAIVNGSITGFLAVVFWTAGYFKFKERQLK